MVLGVCRQLLGDRQHAEDAFQAVFLVLARKARSIRDPDLLGNWLYGVAIRTAGAQGTRSPAGARREEGDAMKAGSGSRRRRPTEPAIDREQAEALHGEIDRLPRAFRLPVVLCYFEGLTLDEAARRLRCPAGTRPQPTGPGARQAPPRPGPPRRRAPAAALAAALAPRSASASISSPPVRYHDPGRDRTSRPDTPPAEPLSAPPRPWPRRS